MRCQDVAQRLTELMEGALEPHEEQAALEHLASCDACEQVLADTRDLVELVRDHGRSALSDADRARMFAALTAGLGESARP